MAIKTSFYSGTGATAEEQYMVQQEVAAAAASAISADSSKVAAASSATAASNSATAALSSKNDAANSAASILNSAANSATSASAAATSATNAAASEAGVDADRVAAEAAASAASTSQTNASTSQTNAATSQTNAATSATNASNSASNASSSASSASTNASNAATSASNASTSETNAATSATNAATSETNASTSETNAATSETNSATSATASAYSAASIVGDVADAQSAATQAQGYRDTASLHKLAAEAAATSATSTASALTGFDLAAIAETKSVTAKDVFVYDTSKDSDGGAWRKRTQGTSWYNETLNTATRGSRREFPAVAVIVTETDTVTIYDGDDPDLPMWMVFVRGTGKLLRATSHSISALNGELVAGTFDGGIIISLLRDTAEWVTASTSWGGDFLGTIADRDSVLDYEYEGTGVGLRTIVNATINDVAMTVLPNAPIDAATGLPRITVAVATSGGLSIIKDDGSVWSPSGSNYEGQNSLAFSEDNKILHSGRVAGTTPKGVNHNNNTTFSMRRSSSTAFLREIDIGNEAFGNIIADERRQVNAPSFVGGNGKGLTTVELDRNDLTNSLVCQVLTTYNTGWMNGDIKLATLSDTDDTDVVGGELVTNGTFTGTGNVVNWTLNGTAVNNNGVDVFDVTAGAATNVIATQVIALTIGNTYRLSFERVTGTADCSVSAASAGLPTLYSGTVGVETRTFVATAASATLLINSASGGLVAILDNISVQLAEPDRSVNGNPLTVHGTVTKTPVATGADLVGYSFGSTGGRSIVTNALIDPAFVAPTGDMSFMFWTTSYASDSELFTIGATNTSMPTNGIHVWTHGYQLKCHWAGSIIYSDVGDLTASAQFICVLRRGSVLELYIDGTLRNSLTNSTAITETGLTIGNGFYAGGGDDMALFRISGTAPSPEQITKIYNDEKVLFQENAQATLYGTSDAVKALAHDDTTDLLHVGTSAGRSVFQGLRRVSNTTTAVGTAISASNNLIVEE